MHLAPQRAQLAHSSLNPRMTTGAIVGEPLHVHGIARTHDLSTVEYFCDRVAVMYLGRILETGTREQVFGAPRHPYRQALLRDARGDGHFAACHPVRENGEPARLTAAAFEGARSR